VPRRGEITSLASAIQLVAQTTVLFTQQNYEWTHSCRCYAEPVAVITLDHSHGPTFPALMAYPEKGTSGGDHEQQAEPEERAGPAADGKVGDPVVAAVVLNAGPGLVPLGRALHLCEGPREKGYAAGCGPRTVAHRYRPPGIRPDSRPSRAAWSPARICTQQR